MGWLKTDAFLTFQYETEGDFDIGLDVTFDKEDACDKCSQAIDWWKSELDSIEKEASELGLRGARTHARYPPGSSFGVLGAP